ncbi:MAG: hypothetical protein FWF46_01700 [Oscillospiraceae bacterium]|nr:hypothetical protein [Oscillospiraceae bacterium]
MKKTKKFNAKRSLIILLLLAVFLIMSTYAWFTSNKLVMVSSMDINVQASAGFQISLDGINWKSLINAADITGSVTSGAYSDAGNLDLYNNHLPSLMTPVSTAGDRDSDTGYLDMFDGAVDVNSDGEYVLTTTAATDDTDTVSYAAFDLYFKTNSDIYLQLDSSAGVKDIGQDGTPNKPLKGMEDAARIAFVDQGNTTAEDSTKNIEQLVDSTGLVTIWEPNADAHTAAAVASARNLYGKDFSTDPGATVPTAASDNWTGTGIGQINYQTVTYDGVKAATLDNSTSPATVITDPILLTNTTAAANASFFSPMTSSPGVLNMLTTKRENSSPTSTGITLKAGVTKMRIYFWIEGQDYDCADSASGSSIRLDLVLTASPV